MHHAVDVGAGAQAEREREYSERGAQCHGLAPWVSRQSVATGSGTTTVVQTRNAMLPIRSSGRKGIEFAGPHGADMTRNPANPSRYLISDIPQLVIPGSALAGSPGMTAFGPLPARRLSFVTNQVVLCVK
jgi:hypothetical protein